MLCVCVYSQRKTPDINHILNRTRSHAAEHTPSSGIKSRMPCTTRSLGPILLPRSANNNSHNAQTYCTLATHSHTFDISDKYPLSICCGCAALRETARLHESSAQHSPNTNTYRNECVILIIKRTHTHNRSANIAVYTIVFVLSYFCRNVLRCYRSPFYL